MKSSPAFWDTSVLVPLCCSQPNNSVIRNTARHYSPFVVWWGAYVECFNTLARLLREGDLAEKQFKQSYGKLQILQNSWVEMLATEQIRELSEKVLSAYSLTSADGLQLAAALAWCYERPRGRIFVCADKKLSQAAESVGFELKFIPVI